MIIIDEANHTYSDAETGTEYTSVTQLLHKMGLAPDYDGVDPAILAKAAEYGNTVHERVEQALAQGEEIPETDPLPRHWKLESSERIVSDAQYMIAGKYDLLMRDEETGKPVLVDIKCTSSPPYDYCSWQLAIYRHLLGLDEMTECHMLWLPKEKYGPQHLIRMRFHSEAEVLRLLSAYRNGTRFHPDEITLIDEQEMHCIAEVMELAERLKRAEARIRDIKSSILEHMINNGIKSAENFGWRFTATSGSRRRTLDADRLKSELPSVYEQYCKESETAPSLKITKVKE